MDDRYVMPDAEKIRQLRQDRFWNQEELAQKAKRTKRTIERAEAGERLQRSTLSAIAQALGVSPETLVRSDPSRGPHQQGVSSSSTESVSAPPTPARALGRDEALDEGRQAGDRGRDPSPPSAGEMFRVRLRKSARE